MNRVIYILITALLTACSFSQETSKTTISETESAEIVKIIEIEVLNLNLVSLTMDGQHYNAQNVDVTLMIDIPGKSYSGKAACNSYFGSLEIVGEDAIKFLPGGSTEMMCEVERMQWEARVYNALFGNTFTATNRKENATFTQVGGDIILVFEKVESIQE